MIIKGICACKRQIVILFRNSLSKYLFPTNQWIVFYTVDGGYHTSDQSERTRSEHLCSYSFYFIYLLKEGISSEGDSRLFTACNAVQKYCIILSSLWKKR